eukprot:g74947.t1
MRSKKSSSSSNSESTTEEDKYGFFCEICIIGPGSKKGKWLSEAAQPTDLRRGAEAVAVDALLNHIRTAYHVVKYCDGDARYPKLVELLTACGALSGSGVFKDGNATY